MTSTRPGVIHGARDWQDYAVDAAITVHLGGRRGSPFAWQFERPYAMSLSGRGRRLMATLDGLTFEAEDETFANGGIGLLINAGALSTSEVRDGAV